jgi:anti-sigma regulatory factor (Ser/Thr protein kinase)
VDPLRQASHHRIDVCDREGAGALRRMVCDHAKRLGATPLGCARVELVATELAANLVQHADQGGWVLTRPLPPTGYELIAVDQGRGIADPAAAVAGRSPAPKGLGRGLAAVHRASAHFSLHSQVGRGTVVLAVVDLAAPSRVPGVPARQWAGVSVGVTQPCGDAWGVAKFDEGLAIAVIDGLGHGPAASAAADAAIAGFSATLGDPAKFLDKANGLMRGTRGAAATLCQLQPELGLLRYVAVGNVNGYVLAGPVRHRLITYSGTLGLAGTTPAVPVLTCPWPEQATLVLWTDGLHSRDVSGSVDAALLACDPAVLAAALYRDHRRAGDDATVVVVRDQNTRPSPRTQA